MDTPTTSNQTNTLVTARNRLNIARRYNDSDSARVKEAQAEFATAHIERAIMNYAKFITAAQRHDLVDLLYWESKDQLNPLS